MRFIELHDVSGMPILVFLQSIVTVCPMDGGSKINLSEGLIFVRETPDQIKIKIHG